MKGSAETTNILKLGNEHTTQAMHGTTHIPRAKKLNKKNLKLSSARQSSSNYDHYH